MIRDFLLRSLPERLVPPAPPRDRTRDRRERRVFLILCVILLLSGWFVPAWIALLAAFLLASAWMWAWSFPTNLIELISDVRRAERAPAEPSPPLLERIRTPLFDRADQSLGAVVFDPQLPFQSPEGRMVWAIDPSRRAVRVVAKVGQGVDQCIAWDEPVRSVEFQRVPTVRWLPMFGDTLAIVRGDRELIIVSGKDQRSAWRYVFRFSRLDRDIGLRWRDIFERWMQEDRNRVAA